MSGNVLLQNNMEISSRVKATRKKMKLTQEAFADMLGISVSGYKKLESGENGISVNMLRELRKLNVSSDYILYGERKQLDNVWFEVNNCDERQKIIIFIKLLMEIYPGQENILMSMEQINEIISAIFYKDEV